MNLNTLLPSRHHVKEWQRSLSYHTSNAGHAARLLLNSLYIRSFAWIGSVEPCTGVLCERCQHCLRDFFILNVRQRRTHHTTASSMLAAVRIGCRICTSLWRQFARLRSIDPENVPERMNEESGEFSYLFSFWWRRDCPNFVVWNMIWLEWEPSAIRNEIVPRIDPFSYLMDHRWKLAKEWLSECLSHHTRCKQVTSADDYYPTRLIDVRANGSNCELRLYSTSNGPIKEPYITLSHCWGEARFLQLTSLTHDRLQQGFAHAELPPTFQDAIMVTRVLGINFLWIDALCIVQDSLVDWQHEATKMSQVYSNSMCNISALDAHDSTGGLFFDHETSNIPYCTFTACRKFKQKRVYEFAYTDVWSDSVHHAPLTRRAWVLQERLLSPRILHFGKRQLLWECNHLRACEFYPKGMPASKKSILSGLVPITDIFLKKSIATIVHGVSDHALTSSQMHGAWNDIVQHYTKCNLTMSKDKLVAISGVVKRLQPLFKTDYLAGLWRDNLLEQLLWVVGAYGEAKPFLAGEEEPKYRAPSWSWASVEAPIKHQQLYPRVAHMATIIEAYVTPLTEDATGEVVDGYVRLRAPLFPVRRGSSNVTQQYNLVWAWGELESLYYAWPDVSPLPAIKQLQFVPLLMTWNPPDYKSLSLIIYGLLLKHVHGKQGVYQRWGIFRLWAERAGEFSNFGVQQIKGQRTYRYDPPERYPEQVITLI